jgi:hypothetical protein
MFNLEFKVDCPWWRDSLVDYAIEGDTYTRLPIPHKRVQVGYGTWNALVGLQLSYSYKGRSHAGLHVQVGLFGYVVCFGAVDERHWDYDTNSWEVNDG